MDLDIQIIDAIRNKPCLYSNSRLEERNIEWKQLSDELKVGEQNLKIRWHSILKRYQNDECYKYANLLHFIKRNIDMKVNSKWPEFEITEDDIAEPHKANTEEYVFLEVEDLETTANITDDKYSDVKDDIGRSDELTSYHNNPATISEDDCLEGREYTMKCEKTYKCNGNKEECSQDEVDSSTRMPNIANKPEQVAAVAVVPTESNTKTESKPPETSISNTDRCEDVIFGELVTAMLKRMSDDKKRTIKKEIMNILLT